MYREGWREAIEQAAKELQVTLDYNAEIASGDLYLAKRNGAVKLLTASTIVKEDNIVGGYIVPKTIDYCYDICECVKIVGGV